MILPPPIRGEPKTRLIQVFCSISRLVERLEQACGDQIACLKGCDTCCREPPWLRGAEAAYLLEGARSLLSGAVSLVWEALEASASGCPLLQGGVCLIPEQRPVACRIRGLPTVRQETGHPVLHHCDRNFQDLDPTRLPPSLILDERHLELQLESVESMYCRRSGWSGETIPVEDLLRAGLRT